MAVLKKRTIKLRKPFYETGDKIGVLLSVSSELKDSKLKELVKKLQETHNKIYKHLESNYIWD
jgi:TorA maturation chaperone TorD